MPVNVSEIVRALLSGHNPWNVLIVAVTAIVIVGLSLRAQAGLIKQIFNNINILLKGVLFVTFAILSIGLPSVMLGAIAFIVALPFVFFALRIIGYQIALQNEGIEG